jgi:hypothetical protein
LKEVTTPTIIMVTEICVSICTLLKSIAVEENLKLDIKSYSRSAEFEFSQSQNDHDLAAVLVLFMIMSRFGRLAPYMAAALAGVSFWDPL